MIQYFTQFVCSTVDSQCLEYLGYITLRKPTIRALFSMEFNYLLSSGIRDQMQVEMDKNINLFHPKSISKSEDEWHMSNKMRHVKITCIPLSWISYWLTGTERLFNFRKNF